MKRLYGIIGYPLGHSLSPLVHNWGFRRLGIEAEYQAWPTPPEELAALLARFRATPLSGASVTIPHKSAVMAFVDTVTELAKAVGAVNTLFWRDGALVGENTDVTGFSRPLLTRNLRPDTALVLGAGGAARAAVAGLVRLGVPTVGISGRTAEKAEILARELGGQAVPWETRTQFPAALLVNATPMGMFGRLEGLSPYPEDALRPDMTVFDLVYRPHPTRLLAAATAAGCQVVPGVEMFFSQAIEQFRLWTGQLLPEEELRALLQKALYGG